MATKTYIVIGDSILSGVPQGMAKHLCLNIVSQNRDVIFKSLASGGAALGVTDSTGFNNAEVITTMQRIAGAYLAFDGILVMAGVNDFNRDVNWGDMYNGLKRIVQYAKDMNKKVIIFDPIWKANENTPNGVGSVLNTYRFFQAYLAGEFPGTCFFAHRENTVMGTSAGSSYYDSAEVAAGTQTHPNVAGHGFLATWIMAEAATAGLF